MPIELSIELVRKCEMAEAMAWRDMVASANDNYKKEFQLSVDVVDDDTYIACPAIPFVHFNCVLGFGTNNSATKEHGDKIINYVKTKNLKLFFVYVVEGLQADAEEILTQKGFVHSGSWDRIYRTNKAATENQNSIKSGWTISEVDDGSADAWASFVSSTYHMPQQKDGCSIFL